MGAHGLHGLHCEVLNARRFISQETGSPDSEGNLFKDGSLVWAVAEREGCTASSVHSDVLSSILHSNDNQFLWELIGGPPKTRNMSACWQDGRFFAENETWVVDSCTKCTCKVSGHAVPGGSPGQDALTPRPRGAPAKHTACRGRADGGHPG